MEKQAKIYVAGHRGMVGSAIVRELNRLGYFNVIVRTSTELDLRNQSAVEIFYQQEKPDYVFVAAAKVGGILANNTYRAEFLYDNLCIQNNLIHNAHVVGVKKLLFLGSSCIYPKLAPQPLKEEYLLSGYLEPTNEPYAIAKITGIKMCEAYRDQYGCNFISAMPTNMYGPNDNYHPENSHVLPALIRKFHEAAENNSPEVVVWGDGTPMREFLYADDLANALVYLMLNYDEREFVNVGYGSDITIGDLAKMIGEIVGFKGEIVFDASKPNGTPKKLMDSGRLFATGWQPKTHLQEGISLAYADFLTKHSTKNN
jgi:GDP-L-fucose synthase